MSLPRINIQISGLSVSGDVDAGVLPIIVLRGDSERVGYARFALQNAGQAYTTILNSGPATSRIDINDITVHRGNIERIDNFVTTGRGHLTIAHSYDKGQELLGFISADARLSGDDGYPIGSRTTFDLVLVVSGVNFQSGARVSNFMSHMFGTDADKDGLMWSFKPSGITTETYYTPDGSPDKNANYWIPKFEVRREYAWDALRKMQREIQILDVNSNIVSLDSYTDVSGAIHIFTSGSSEFFASGPGGAVTLTYYRPGTSGAERNNVVSMSIPWDSASIKNMVLGFFPTWTAFPTDGDFFTDLIMYSGGAWSGINVDTSLAVLSGNAPAISGRGFISIMVTNSGTSNLNETKMIFTWSGELLNLQKLRGGSGPIDLFGYYRFNSTNVVDGFIRRQIQIFDDAGNYIIKSGERAPLDLVWGKNNIDVALNDSWVQITDSIFKPNGAFNSGNGRDGGWNIADGGTFPTLTKVKQILFGAEMNVFTGPTPDRKELYVDLLGLQFGYNFSPVQARNNNSITMYKRRYLTYDYPLMVTDVEASGIVTHMLNARQAPVQAAEVVVKDNPLGPPTQLYVNPGQVVDIDAPSMNTGSGRFFRYWKAVEVGHVFSTAGGFTTEMRLIPWFSGTLTATQTNLVDYNYQYQRFNDPSFMPIPITRRVLTVEEALRRAKSVDII